MRILVVCLGNICRSPTAEAVLRAMAPADVQVDSAGTGSWHVGDAPHPQMTRAAARAGYDLAALRARQVTAQDFTRFDLILAMDRSNASDLEALRPPGNATPVRLFLEGQQPDEMPDPYFTGGFDGVVALTESGARAVLADLPRLRE